MAAVSDLINDFKAKDTSAIKYLEDGFGAIEGVWRGHRQGAATAALWARFGSHSDSFAVMRRAMTRMAFGERRHGFHSWSIAEIRDERARSSEEVTA